MGNLKVRTISLVFVAWLADFSYLIPGKCNIEGVIL